MTGQISQFLRKTENGIAHFCPACAEMHEIYIDRPNIMNQQWRWNGNVIEPTIEPSVHIIYRNDSGITGQCHYELRNGRISFKPDSSHQLKALACDLPALPHYMRDRRP